MVRWAMGADFARRVERTELARGLAPIAQRTTLPPLQPFETGARHTPEIVRYKPFTGGVGMPEAPMSLVKGTLDILILRTLGWGPTHGYAISRWIRDTTADELQIEEGALYPALRRLEERGLLDSAWKRTESGREAKVYHLTAGGKQQLQREVAGWTRYVSAMTRVLDARPTGAIV